MIYDELIEKLIGHFTTGDFAEEVAMAKREFFENASIVSEETAHFDLRMSQFLDWYLFTRELSEFQIRPIQLATELEEFGGDSQEGATEEKQLRSLLEHQHAFYEFLKIKDGDIYVKDLFTGKKIILKDSEVQYGFNSDELFEARIFPDGDNFVFSKGFCFHPSEVRKFILKEIKKVKKLSKSDHEDLMLRIQKMRYKHEQYQHIRLDYIYTNEPKLKF